MKEKDDELLPPVVRRRVARRMLHLTTAMMSASCRDPNRGCEPAKMKNIAHPPLTIDFERHCQHEDNTCLSWIIG
jgi:hypothetical protein